MKLKSWKKCQLPATLCAVSFFGALTACSPAPTKPPTRSKASDAMTASTTELREVKESVSPDILNSSALGLNMLGVIPFSHGRQKFPQVSFAFPAQADYVQILRCRADANLGDLGNIEIGAADAAKADATYERNDYWQKISTNAFCTYIAQGVSTDKIIDFYAPDGDFVYVARACVEKNRLSSKDPNVLQSPCSRQIRRTTEYRGFVNVDKKITFEMKQQMREQRDRVDAMGREIVYLAKATDREISSCESQRGATRASKLRREALGKIIGTGLNLGVKLLSDGLAKSLLGGIAGVFTGVFNDLSTKPEDFLPAEFCPSADANLGRMKTLKTQIEVESEDYRQRIKVYGEPE